MKGTLFENLEDIVPETERWLQQPQPAGLIVGENQDGLAFEKPYKRLLGVTPLELLVPLFQNHNPIGHTLIVLSKFTSTQYAEVFGPVPNVVFSWSLSIPSISDQYEKKVSSLTSRLAKAASMKAAGYRIRFRLDALAPVPDWEDEVRWVMGWINTIKPEMLTIGALRASNVGALRTAAKKNKRDASIFDYIENKDPSGFKYRTNEEFHKEAFQLVKDLLHPEIKLGLCKEDQTMWQVLAVGWEGCHCLHGKEDRVFEERMQQELLQITQDEVETANPKVTIEISR